MLSDYLNFKKLITPLLVQVVFWIAVIGNTIGALFYSDGFMEGLLELIIGPIFIRIFCEGLIVVFEINNTLIEIRDHQRSTIVAPQPPRPVTPPPSTPAP